MASLKEENKVAAVIGFVLSVLQEATGSKIEGMHADIRFEEIGLDSLAILSFNSLIQPSVPQLSKTLLFDCRCPRDVAMHMIEQHGEAVERILQRQSPEHPAAREAPASVEEADWPVLPLLVADEAPAERDIAIVGLHGRYPGADNPETLWRNLLAGSDSIIEIPDGRWPLEGFYAPAADARESGLSYAKWGGFLEGIERFDPEFFSITPREAAYLDPQERLFMECAWHTLEAAGYTGERAQLLRQANGAALDIGVFVGITSNTFPLLGPALWQAGDTAIPTGMPWSVANRVSYTLNLFGPSLAIDTACSSSLTALHMAVASLRNLECKAALVGGVNLYTHPAKYVQLCQQRMLSPTGRCHAFGEAADGFVPGEGVGAILIRPLQDARRDGDRILAVIKGSAINHGARSNGYTVPSAASQAALIISAVNDARVAPGSIGYVEAHGTGTRLGDPIEVEGLRQALGEDSAAAPCHIGSIKSNIGHLEAAAGLASLTKVILQLKERRLAPSLHADIPNPDLALKDTRLRIVRQAQPWTSPEGPLRAGISSFGAGGANAHVILEEAPPLDNSNVSPGIGVFVLSARSQPQLREQARQLLDLLRQQPCPDWQSLAYTLQCCRQAFEYRLALLADESAALMRGLEDFLDGREDDGIFTARFIAHRATTAVALPQDETPRALARRWVEGAFSEWGRFWPQPPLPMAAPLYPFERERHWPATDARAVSRTAASGKFEWIVPGDAFYLRDHVIQGSPVLPAAAYMDFFCTRAERHDLRLPLLFDNITWASPIIQQGRQNLSIPAQFDIHDGALTIELRATPEAASSFRGKCRPLAAGAPRSLDLRRLREKCTKALDTRALYRDLERMGIDYGPSFRCLDAAWLGQEEALTQVTCRLPQRGGAPISALDPAMLDAVLQSAFVTIRASDRADGMTFVPYACKSLRCHAALGGELFVLVQTRASGPSSRVFDFAVADNEGRLLVEIEGFAFRVYQSEPRMAVHLLEAHWRNLPTPDEGQGGAETTLLVGADAAMTYPDGVWRVFPGQRFHYRDGHSLEADLSDPRHAELLLRLLRAQRQEPRAVVFDLSALPEIETADWRYTLGLGKALQVSQMVRNLCRAMSPPKLHIHVLTPPRPATSLAALLRTIVQEIPTLSATLIETGDATERPALLAGLSQLAQPGMRHLRLQAGRWQERSLRFAETPAAPAGGFAGGLEPGDILLVSGGLGAIGRVLSRTLADVGGLHLALLGRSAPSDTDNDWLRELERLGAASASYWPVDCADSDGLRAVLDDIRRRSGPIRAVLHCAGTLQDGYFTRQENTDWDAILRTKALAANTLNSLTAEDDLKLFMTCSSLAGIYGNVGQGGYALANAWLDQFIAQRETQVQRGERKGRSLSIAWPLWQTEQGMQAPAPVRQWLEDNGLGLLPEDLGAATFLQAIAMPQSLLVPVYGRSEAIAKLFAIEADPHSAASPPEAPTSGEATESLPYLLDYLSRQLSEVTGTVLEKIDPDTSLEAFGLDSILVMELNLRLEKIFPAIPKTLLFEVRSLRELAATLQADYPDDAARLAPAAPPTEAIAAPPRNAPPAASAPQATHCTGPSAPEDDEGIAIIGLAGRYPGAPDPQALWQHLAAGSNLISEVQRWQQPDGSDALYARWGGFIDDFDCFDPLFFGISPRDAERMDPQERLFLLAAWHCVEDAGYTPQSLSGSRSKPEERRRVSVIAGVMYGEYQFYGAKSWPKRPEILTNSSYASIANRVSFCLDFDGPSFAIDSMCSSSLTSLHLACDLIRSGTCDLALAGGVNLSLHPYKYRTLCELGFASSQGQCRSFGEGGDGYVPGEGVGVVLLKPLSQARRDGDHIYGVIRGSDLNHGGRTSGYTVPNADAQSQVIARTLRKSRLPVHRLGYVEAHGTGTSLGDPIEIRGLDKAIGQAVEPDWRCPIGSIKSNIGHLESAAGIAALTKVLLQLQHQQLAPSLHAQPPNPNIDFEKSHFIVQQTLDAWPARLDEQHQPLPRVAAISSFGAGGANAHLIVEEHPLPTQTAAATGMQPFVFSARSAAQLRAYLRRFATFLEDARGFVRPDPEHYIGRPGFTTLDVAHTLLNGRMRCEEARLVVLAEDFDALRQKLGEWLTENDPQPGQILHDGSAGEPFQVLARQWLEGKDIALLAPEHHVLRKVPLPGYEFLRRRYWVDEAAIPFAAPVESATPAPAPAQTQTVPQTPEHPSPQSILERVKRKQMSIEQARELLQAMI
ncbi:SDR family NAD(P)-dependent oxidoreductase [Pseudochelatococcus contaminans]|uniref:Polyketide synthase PksN n=1 Tax=Pseudochelatococcus contaminans TaxID=1538103 RepID=A0A7W5Z7W0_9HYPH|nr:SDR family NAD(P)-dependent oxidoreductase [Pseudochelatococcus contaminans]MBB3811111.1 polyketide synthase PksN [Pseudochelatococcus contaminans]